MNKKIIVGNWKMNPETLPKAKEIYSKYTKEAKKLKKADVVVCAPCVYTHSLRALKGAPRLFIGAQDVSYQDEGSHTGEINTKMLKNAGVTHIILGHSERRAMGETDDMVNKKVRVSLAKGFNVVLCIGESERDRGGKFYNVIQKEIEDSLSRVDMKSFKKIIIAYEPIWAIGKPSDEAMDGGRMREMNIFIRKAINDLFGKEASNNVRVIYGGSVDSSNIEEIIENGHVDGVLPGRASLNPKEFMLMIKIVDKLS